MKGLQKRIQISFFSLIRLRFLLLGLFIATLVSQGLAQDIESIGKEKPIKVSGSLSAFADMYAVNGIAPRSLPFVWRLTGNPNLHLFGMVFPFYFNIGTQNRSFAQPFNQFGVSPRYKWFTAHAGWRSLSYSQYTLSGLMFLGGGVDIMPGKFRFSAMYGRFTRVVREDVAQQFVNPVPVYTRRGFAAKIGVGSSTNYLDFIFFKAKDDSTSYEDAPYRLRPAENAVFGLNGRFLIAKHLQITLDGAASAFTRNASLAQLEGPEYDRVRPILMVNTSTQFLTAFNSSIGYVSKLFNFRARYRRVDQDYKSMGAYLFETDAEAFTLEPSFSIFKRKLRLSGSIGQQRDNLLKTKMITTSRTIGSAAISWNPGKTYGLDLQYGNYGIAQRAGVAPINDTTRLALANQNVNVINRLSFINSRRAVTFVLMNIYQEMKNLNPVSPAFIQSTVFISNLNFNYTFIKQQASITGGINYSRNQFSQGEVIMVGPMIGGGKSFFKNKINTSLSAGFMQNRFTQTNDVGLTANASLNVSFNVHKNQNFVLNIRGIRNTASNPLAVPFSEGFFTAGYQLQIP
jgi:hypothetical protein